MKIDMLLQTLEIMSGKVIVTDKMNSESAEGLVKDIIIWAKHHAEKFNNENDFQVKQISKKINMERFIYTKENIGLLDVMVHDVDKYKSIITDEPELTSEIELLGKAVLRFEQITGLKIKVN
jgi:TATA-box binding protein (TBP) (component of TFIID and TFIIIB)